MENKKLGFTLIELLGVLAVLAIIIMVAVPSFIESNRVAQSNEVDDFNETIEVATKGYINSCSSFDTCLEKHSDGFESLFEGEATTISVGELIETGFIKEDLTNPSTGSSINSSDTISVSNNNGKLQVTYGG